MWAHQFPEAIAAADKAIELAPDENWPYILPGHEPILLERPVPEAYWL